MYALRFRSAVRPWVTCGMYPQFVVITFPQMMSVRSVDLRTCQGNEGGFQISDDLLTILFVAREVSLEKSVNESSATQFTPVTSVVFRNAGGNMQER